MNSLRSAASDETATYAQRMARARAEGESRKDDAAFAAELRAVLLAENHDATVAQDGPQGEVLLFAGLKTRATEDHSLFQMCAAAAVAMRSQQALLAEVLGCDSTLLHNMAAKALAQQADDSQLVELWRGGVPAVKSRLLRCMRQERRVAALDAIYELLPVAGRADLLHCCSPAVVAAGLADPAVVDHASVYWLRVARFHPDALLEAITNSVGSNGHWDVGHITARWQWWTAKLQRKGGTRRNPCWELACARPAQLFALLARFTCFLSNMQRTLCRPWSTPQFMNLYLKADVEAVVRHWTQEYRGGSYPVLVAPSMLHYFSSQLSRGKAGANLVDEATCLRLFRMMADGETVDTAYAGSSGFLMLQNVNHFNRSVDGIVELMHLVIGVYDRIPPARATAVRNAAAIARSALADAATRALGAINSINVYRLPPTEKAAAAARVVRELTPRLTAVVAEDAEIALNFVFGLISHLPPGSAEACSALFELCRPLWDERIAVFSGEEAAMAAPTARAALQRLRKVVAVLSPRNPRVLAEQAAPTRHAFVTRIAEQVVPMAPTELAVLVKELVVDPLTTVEEAEALLAPYTQAHMQAVDVDTVALMLGRLSPPERARRLAGILTSEDFTEDYKRALAPLQAVDDLAVRDCLQQQCDSASPEERLDAIAALLLATLIDGSVAQLAPTLAFVVHKTRNVTQEQRAQFAALVQDMAPRLVDVLLFAPDSTPEGVAEVLAHLDEMVEAALSAQDSDEDTRSDLRVLTQAMAAAATRLLVALRMGLSTKWPPVSDDEAPAGGGSRGGRGKRPATSWADFAGYASSVSSPSAFRSGALFRDYQSVMQRAALDRVALPRAETAVPAATAVAVWAGKTQLALKRHVEGDDANEDFALSLGRSKALIGPHTARFSEAERLAEAEIVLDVLDAAQPATCGPWTSSGEVVVRMAGFFGVFWPSVPRLAAAAEALLEVLTAAPRNEDGLLALATPVSRGMEDSEADEAANQLEALFVTFRQGCRGLGRAHRWRDVPVLNGFVEALMGSTLAPGAFPTWFAAAVTKTRADADRDAAVQRLLAISPSAVHLKPVWRHLVAHRQDLLTPFLAPDCAFEGVFHPDYSATQFLLPLLGHAAFERKGASSAMMSMRPVRRDLRDRDRPRGGKRGRAKAAEPFLLPAVWDLRRLQPAQSRALGERLMAVALDASKATTARVAAMRRWTCLITTTYADIAAFLAEHDPTVVPPVTEGDGDSDSDSEEWMDVDGESKEATAMEEEEDEDEDEDAAPAVPVALIEAALKGLMRGDEPCAPLGYMLSPKWLTTERSRIAAYTVTHCLPYILPEQLEPLVDTLLVDSVRPRLKVTAFKQLLRLVGSLHATKRLEVLEREWFRPKQHRDVRVAMLQTGLEMIESEAEGFELGWRMVESAVQLGHLVEAPDAKAKRDKAVRAGKAGNNVGTKRLAADAEAKAAKNKAVVGNTRRLRVAPKNAQELVMTLLAGSRTGSLGGGFGVEGLRVANLLATTLSGQRVFTVPASCVDRYVSSVLLPLSAARNPDVAIVALGCLRQWVEALPCPQYAASREACFARLAQVASSAATAGRDYWVHPVPDVRARNILAARQASAALASGGPRVVPAGHHDYETVPATADALVGFLVALATAARAACEPGALDDVDGIELRVALLSYVGHALRSLRLLCSPTSLDSELEERCQAALTGLPSTDAPLFARRAALLVAQVQRNGGTSPPTGWMPVATAFVDEAFARWAQDPGCQWAVTEASGLLASLYHLETSYSRSTPSATGAFVQLSTCMLRLCLAPPAGVSRQMSLSVGLKLIDGSTQTVAAAVLAETAVPVVLAALRFRSLKSGVVGCLRHALNSHVSGARQSGSQLWRGFVTAVVAEIAPAATDRGDVAALEVMRKLIQSDADSVVEALSGNVVRDLLACLIRRDAAEESESAVACCSALVRAYNGFARAMVGMRVPIGRGEHVEVTGYKPRGQRILQTASHGNYTVHRLERQLQLAKLTTPAAGALWQALLAGSLDGLDLDAALASEGAVTLTLEALSLAPAAGSEEEREAAAALMRRGVWATLKALPALPLQLDSSSAFARYLSLASALDSDLRMTLYSELPRALSSALRRPDANLVEVVNIGEAARAVRWVAAADFVPEPRRTPDVVSLFGKAAVELLVSIATATMTSNGDPKDAATVSVWAPDLVQVAQELQQHPTPSVRDQAFAAYASTERRGCARF